MSNYAVVVSVSAALGYSSQGSDKPAWRSSVTLVTPLRFVRRLVRPKSFESARPDACEATLRQRRRAAFRIPLRAFARFRRDQSGLESQFAHMRDNLTLRSRAMDLLVCVKLTKRDHAQIEVILCGTSGREHEPGAGLRRPKAPRRFDGLSGRNSAAHSRRL